MTERAEQEKREIFQEKRRRRDILERLRNIGKEVQAVEQRVIDDFGRADREIRLRG